MTHLWRGVKHDRRYRGLLNKSVKWLNYCMFSQRNTPLRTTTAEEMWRLPRLVALLLLILDLSCCFCRSDITQEILTLLEYLSGIHDTLAHFPIIALKTHGSSCSTGASTNFPPVGGFCQPYSKNCLQNVNFKDFSSERDLCSGFYSNKWMEKPFFQYLR